MFTYIRELCIRMPIDDDFRPPSVGPTLFRVVLDVVWSASQEFHAFVDALPEIQRSIDDTDMGILCLQRVLS